MSGSSNTGQAVIDEIFPAEYLVDLNAGKAVQRCGLHKDNIKAARTMGWRLLKKISVQDIIAKEFTKRSSRTYLSIDKVLKEISILLSSDITDYIGSNGIFMHGKRFDDMPEDQRRCIQSIKQTVRVVPGDEEGAEILNTEFKMYNKLDALKQAAQHLGIEMDKLQVMLSGDVNADAVKVASHITVAEDVAGPKRYVDLVQWESDVRKAREMRERDSEVGS